ncbi:hypothetical protein OC834_001046 [Tilletia horrida]|nr:hypothetical protein OC834_001046 [Tilletia horrida]
MDRILGGGGGGGGRRWLRLGVRAAAVRTAGSSIASSSRAAAGATAAATATAAEPSTSAHRATALSAKARGKQREVSPAASTTGLASPYLDDGQSSSACSSSSIVADIELLQQQLTDGSLGDEQEQEQRQRRQSAQAWLAVLGAHSASSYSTAAPYLLSTGAFYCSPLEGRPGGRALLARLHCHLLASQIHSSADAELALKVLQRLCALGSRRPHSTDAWPPLLSATPLSGATTSSSARMHDLQLRLISTFSRNVDVALAAVSIALERIVRDVGVAHLAPACVRLAERVAHRFRAQVGPAPRPCAQKRYNRSGLVKRQQGARWASRRVRRFERRTTHRKAQAFRELLCRLAHLLPHRPFFQHSIAATRLLKSIVVMCNVHARLSQIKNTNVWPSYNLPYTVRLGETRSSNLPRRPSRRRPYFDAELCRDVARALLDVPTAGQSRLVAPIVHSITTPRHIDASISELDHSHSTSAQGLRSGKRPAFLSLALARACVLAIFASTLHTAHKPRREPFAAAHLVPDDFIAVIRALSMLQSGHGSSINAYHISQQFIRLANRAERKEALWTQQQHHQLYGHSEFAGSRTTAGNLGSDQRLLYYLQICHNQARRPSSSVSAPGRMDRFLVHHTRRLILRTAGHIFAFHCPSLARSLEAQQAISLDEETLDQAESESKLFDLRRPVDINFLRQALKILGQDPVIPAGELLDLIAGDAPEHAASEEAKRQLAELRLDTQAIAELIYGFVLRAEWAAIDELWHMATARRAHLHGSFDHISRAYLRSQRTHCEQVPGHLRSAVMHHALLQVWEQAELNTNTDPMRRRAPATPLSIKLARDIVHYTGIIVGEPEAALKLWADLHRDHRELALSWRMLAAMLSVSGAAEASGASESGHFGLWARSSSSSGHSASMGHGPGSAGMKARALFRRYLFAQHPSLAPWSDTAPLSPLEQVDAGGEEGKSSMSLFGSMLLKVAVRGRRLLPWSQSASAGTRAGRGDTKRQTREQQFDSVLGATTLPRSAEPAPVYIHFNALVFEAYVGLLHTMTVPESPLISSGWAAPPSRDAIAFEASAPAVGGSLIGHASGVGASAFMDGLDDGVGTRQSGSQEREDALISHSRTAAAGPTAAAASQAAIDTDAQHPPTPDELLLVLAWMRALRVRPTRSTLCLLCIHLLETLPPGLIRPGQPAGPLTAWLEEWIGWGGVPTEDDVGAWMRRRRMEMREKMAREG